MIEGARKKARRARVEDMLSFEVGNAGNTCHEDESFDIVISEGTTVLKGHRRSIS